VYISGADTFDAGQVRAAFDEVRSTLGLDSDTVLFGVPVDDLIVIRDEKDISDSKNMETTELIKEDAEPIVSKLSVEQDVTNESPVVPILSVLGAKTEDVVAPMQETTIQEVEINKAPEVVDIDDDIEEMLNDDVPDLSHEKTLEELLETITPLREDTHQANPETTEPLKEDVSLEDTDATLASLATEFVNVQDKVPTVKKSSERGKIGRLKNILPFKKIKHDDTGIMGDLFGWAGVAANDEDFSIPGFFTNVVSKK